MAGSLGITGRELDPSKSWCYIIDFEWKNNEFIYHTKEDMPGDFTLNDKYGTPYPLKRLDVHKGSETLGLFIAMDENQTDQSNNLREKSEVFAKQIRASYYNANTAIYTYNSCFVKSMKYCMPVTNFLEKELNHIVAKKKKKKKTLL